MTLKTGKMNARATEITGSSIHFTFLNEELSALKSAAGTTG